MPTVLVLGIVKAMFEFGRELCKFLQTRQGGKLVDKILEDRENWDKAWKEVDRGLRKLFSGRLFLKGKVEDESTVSK